MCYHTIVLVRTVHLVQTAENGFSMITLDLKSRKPIYEQIVDNIKTLVLSGVLAPDEQLPAVRKLAVDLAINPNTIQKAYAILEAQRIVYSIPGRGSFVSGEVQSLQIVRRGEILERLEDTLKEAKNLSIGKKEILEAVDKVYFVGNGDKGEEK